MRVQKPTATKQLQNDFSTKKMHRRVNTEIDQHAASRFYKPQIKKTIKTSSKPKFLDVYSKYSNSNNNPSNVTNLNLQTTNNNKQLTSTQRSNFIANNTKNFKLIPPKQTYAIKQLRTEPDQIFRKQEKPRQQSKKKIYTNSNIGNPNFHKPQTANSKTVHTDQFAVLQVYHNASGGGTNIVSSKHNIKSTGNGNVDGNNTSKLVGESRYEFHGLAGKGTFGVVYTGKDKITNQKIAIKKVFQDKKYKNRQHLILQILKHPNVLQMRDSFLTYQGQQQYLNIIMDFYPDNLYQVVKKKEINPLNLKLYSYQLFRALNYLTLLSISHRDMKPQNVLVDLVKNKVIICDFGSAKKLVKNEANLAYICSRCYRAPQLIFGATNYTTQIDVWSMGCILVEMINGYPPFLADSQIDQLIEIIKVLGTPTEEDIGQMNPKYDMKEYSKFPKIKPTHWKNVHFKLYPKLLKTKDPLLIDLVNRTLQYSPFKRITPAEALFHEYFDDLRDEMKYFEMKQKLKNIPELFNFTQDEMCFIQQQMKGKIPKHLIPKWVKVPGKIGTVTLNSKLNTMSNMITKPSSGQGSRVLTGTSYIGKKITLNVNNK